MDCDNANAIRWQNNPCENLIQIEILRKHRHMAIMRRDAVYELLSEIQLAACGRQVSISGRCFHAVGGSPAAFCPRSFIETSDSAIKGRIPTLLVIAKNGE